MGLEAEGEDGDKDEEDGGEGDDPRPGGRVRLVKQRPDLRLRPLPTRRLTCMVKRRIIHCKKRLARMSLTKLSLAGNNLIYPSQGEFGK